MAHIGIAHAAGSNYNKEWEMFGPGEVDEAVSLIKASINAATSAMNRPDNPLSKVEKAMVKAISHRVDTVNSGSYIHWNERYMRAMGELHSNFPDDLDVVTLYAESMMNLTPWKLWNLYTGEPAVGSHALEIKTILDHALHTQPEAAHNHPGIVHLYIHLTEMSPSPEDALAAARCLAPLVPDSGHLLHMSSHIDFLMGNYQRVITDNIVAAKADAKYLVMGGREDNYYLFYRLHNLHFVVYGAMFKGSYGTALHHADELEKALPPRLLRPMADVLESYYPTRVMVLIRFGKWDEILALDIPTDGDLYSLTIAFTHFGKALAHSALQNVSAAEVERDLYLTAVQRVPSSRLVFPNKVEDVLAVGTAMLQGELEYRKGNTETAFDFLRTSIKCYDGLVYAEPWSWLQPVRHAYAALKLETGEFEEALATYSADLGFDHTLPRSHQHPNNVWALHGYHECLVKLGRSKEAEKIKPILDLALGEADVEISSSCFCRLTEGDSTSRSTCGC